LTGLIYHLVTAADFRAAPANRPYLPAAFSDDGFIHCTEDQALLLVVANLVYRGEAGEFLVLDIDPQRLTSELRRERPAPPPPPGSPLAEAFFPHIYGPLNREAIVAVRPARRATDGTFLAV
jgi:uncharacterized protein (DUF952 family)